MKSLAVLVCAAAVVMVNAQRPGGRRGGRPDFAGEGRGQGRPDVDGERRPDFSSRGRPDFAGQGRPDLAGRGRPDVDGERRPDFSGRGRPDFAGQGRPDFAGRREGEGRRREMPDGVSYSYNQTLSTGQVVEEKVFIPDNSSIVVTRNRGDREAGFFPSTTVYDFSGEDVVAVVFSHRGPCVRIPSTLFYQDFVVAAGIVNNTDNSVAPDAVSLVATAEPVVDENNTLFEQNPLLRFKCRSGVVDALPAAVAAPYDGEILNVKVLTYENELSLTIRDLRSEWLSKRGKGRGPRRG